MPIVPIDQGTQNVRDAAPSRPAIPRSRLIGLELVCAIASVKKSTIYSWLSEKDSNFPRPIRLSSRCVRWDEEAVYQWVQDRISEAA